MGFLSDFFGGSARKDIRRGQEAANKELTTGEATARGDYDEAIAGLDPYEQGGRAGFEAYNATLGLGPEGSREAVQQSYLNDPIQNAIADRITKRFSRIRANTGEVGTTTSALTNALLDRYSAYQDRLKGVGDTGVTTAGAQSTLRAGQGDISFGAAQQRAGVDIGAANALAASRSTGINNILGALGTAAKFVGARKPA